MTMQDMMGATDIAFPNIGIYLKNVPKSFSIFGFEIAWYGVLIALGVLAGLLMAVHEAKRTGQDPENYWDFSIYAIIFSLIGARIYYVVFAWDNFKDNLWSILNLRNGGIAIYGAVIGAFLSLVVYTKIKKLSLRQMVDTCVLGLILGQVIGRWGNFMNREAFGDYTDGFLAMRLPLESVRIHEVTETMFSHMAEGINYIQVHPTFLYESLWNVLIFVLLVLYRKHKKFEGELCLMYLAGYGLGRYFIEGLRTDQLLWPGSSIAVSQVLAVLMIVGAVLTEVCVRWTMKKKKIEE